MAIKIKKISDYPEGNSFVGLWTLGYNFAVNGVKQSVRVSLEFIKTAIDNAITATNEAKKATKEANSATSGANSAKDRANTAADGAITATSNANTATGSANTATTNAVNATNSAKTATSNSITATEKADTATNNAITATGNAVTATNNADTAASSATVSAANATSATTSAKAVIDRTNQANELANSVIQRANDISDLGLKEIVNMQAIIQQVINYAQIVPTRIELEYSPKVTLGNPIEQSIVARLYPKFVTQNTLFLPADGDAIVVDPLGRITITKTGKSNIYVIPTHNTSLMQTVEIEIVPPYMREIGAGGLRLLSNGTLRLT